MSDEELKEEQGPEEGSENVLDQENEELNTEWLGEEEWGDEEDEDEIIEEDVPTFIDNGDGTGQITHQRADNSRHTWNYNSGIQETDEATGDNTAIGTLDPRDE